MAQFELRWAEQHTDCMLNEKLCSLKIVTSFVPMCADDSEPSKAQKVQML